MGSYQSAKSTLSDPSEVMAPLSSPIRRRSSTPGLDRQEMKTVIKIKHDYISNDYYIQYPSIGRGSYGEVFKVTHKITGIVRAAKKIERMMMTDEADLMKEYSVLKTLQHPNIIKMYEIYREDKYNYIVTEYCDGGELFNRLAKEKRFGEATAAGLMHQIFYGVAYCHMKGIIHGDLKPENIMLDNAADPSQQVKLADFGASRFKSEKRKLIFGTCLYRAPEVFKNKANEKCDIWSCGIMLYNLIVGSLPFKFENEAEDQDEIKQQILLGRIDTKNPNYEHASPAFKDLLRQLIEIDPDRRISAADALHHKWFATNVQPVKVSDKQIMNCLLNIREYCLYRDIQLLCIHYICRFMMEGKEVRRLAPIYKFLDSGQKGVLSKKQLLDYLAKNASSRLNADDIEDMMDRLGKKDLTITFLGNATVYLEFTQCCVRKQAIITSSNIEKLFCIIDRKGVGKVGGMQMQQCLGGTVTTYERILKEFNGNSSAVLSKQEFQRCVGVS